MHSWPALGTRVTVRYRRPAGSVPPLTDAVGHLLEVEPVVRVRTKTGAVVEFAPADVVALRTLTDAPVRTSAIRALEHAVAAAWPGVEQTWLDGWLLRAGHDVALTANSAVPLDISAQMTAVPAIVAWYERQGLTPWLVIPDRLLALPPGLVSDRAEQILVRAVAGGHAGVSPASARDVSPASARNPLFGDFARAAVTDATDGTRWVGLSEIRAEDHRAAVLECEQLLAWGAQRGATHGYLQVGDGDTGAATVAESLGFRLHHRRRYVHARSAGWDTV
jgi:N-acetylglutamate synthase